MRLSDRILLQNVDGGIYVILDESTGTEIALAASELARLELGIAHFRRDDPALFNAHQQAYRDAILRPNGTTP
jgi:hypothetical protein